MASLGLYGSFRRASCDTQPHRQTVSLNEHRKSLLVSGEAIRLGVGTSLFLARLDVFSYLARCACSCHGRTDAQAAAHIHVCIDRYDVDIGSGLLH